MENGISPIDILKNMLGVVNDCELAPLLGCTKQAIASARSRGRISNRLLGAASKKCGIGIDELKSHLITAIEDAHNSSPSKEELWNEFKKCLEDNRRLLEDNRRLVLENHELRIRCGQLSTLTDDPKKNI